MTHMDPAYTPCESRGTCLVSEVERGGNKKKKKADIARTDRVMKRAKKADGSGRKVNKRVRSSKRLKKSPGAV